MNRSDAHTGTQVTRPLADGTHQTGTILAPPADQSERVLVAWRVDTTTRRVIKLVPIAELQLDHEEAGP